MLGILPAKIVTGDETTVQPIVCHPDDPTKCSQPILEGQVAVFSGQLLTTRLAIDLGLKAEFCERKIKLEVELAKNLADVEISRLQTILSVRGDSWKTQRQLLLDRLDEAADRSFYREPWFVATVTTVIIGSLATLVIWAVLESRSDPVQVEVLTYSNALIGWH